MGPTNRYNRDAVFFTTALFDLNKKIFDDALSEDIDFSSEAELVDHEGHVTPFAAHIEGKEKVSAVFAQRVFDITSNVVWGPFSFKPLDTNQVKVKFVTDETKKEKDGDVRYHYKGHYVLSFVTQPDGAAKINKIALWNRRSAL